ncbi:nuclear transport factor 2 family protein [[Mycobacterium] wendilense]|uniref:Nuclear transport factor 2 family protein n=1 Tax=[Mycobacterium] wendilense TaxID=3064284 RepID=A0ABM9MKE2_9MYCO|nr:nuclear transport factor 2 family protein [Mycolicibacterium sp. MU0050]CAJ1587423.1 nuclear transport factor 2 family protein [Mycolicibacterium sp. MU0050]
MTIDKTTVQVPGAALPPVITAYLAAQLARDATSALAAFTADAVVTDEGRTYRGRQQIAAWLGRAASEYTYTTEFTGSTQNGPESYDVTAHLEGDFPGGVADLHFRFVLDGALIARLVIEP